MSRQRIYLLLRWGIIIFLFLIGISVFVLKENLTIKKKSVLAGWASGGSFDYELMLYTDSSYHLTTLSVFLGYDGGNKWKIDNDTFLLISRDTIQARTFENKLNIFPLVRDARNHSPLAIIQMYMLY